MRSAIFLARLSSDGADVFALLLPKAFPYTATRKALGLAGTARPFRRFWLADPRADYKVNSVCPGGSLWPLSHMICRPTKHGSENATALFALIRQSKSGFDTGSSLGNSPISLECPFTPSFAHFVDPASRQKTPATATRPFALLPAPMQAIPCNFPATIFLLCVTDSSRFVWQAFVRLSSPPWVALGQFTFQTFLRARQLITAVDELTPSLNSIYKAFVLSTKKFSNGERNGKHARSQNSS